MKKLYIILAAALAVAGCSNFDEMNTTSTALTKDQLPPANVFARMVYKGTFADSQRNYNIGDDLFAYYFSDNTTWWQTIYGTYNDGWAGCLWWEHYDQFIQYDKMIKDFCGEKPEYAAMAAISDVMTVFHWIKITDRWGDVPYTGAGDGENVDFTSQKDIYADLLARLEKDGEALNTTVAQYNPSNYDLIYNGDYGQWKKLCYSLMLRLATRVAKADPAMSKTYAQKALAGGLMTKYDDTAIVPCDATTFGDYYDRTSYDWYQTIPDANFVSVLNGDNKGYTTGVQDPRIKVFFVPADAGANAGKYIGYPHGNPTAAEAEVAMTRTDNTSGYYFSTLNQWNKNGYFYNADHTEAHTNLGFPLLTYSETLFCQAELALRGIISGNAEELFKKGVEASINEAYDHTKVSGKGVESLDAAAKTAYVNAVDAMFGADNESQLRSIIIQKWIAIYPNGTEGWNEIRRTGYPDIASGVLNYAGTTSKNANALVTEGNTMQRYSYPNNVYDYDVEHVPAAYQPGGQCYTMRQENGVWWSLAGQDKPFKATTKPSNF
jgi:hypothetical protein